MAGTARINNDTRTLEFYDGTGWKRADGTLTGTVSGSVRSEDIVDNNNQYRVHTFTGTGSFIPDYSGEVEYLIVGGGGSGGADNAGGGGGGGVLMGTYSVVSGTTYNVTVGTGGDQTIGNQGRGNNGTASTLFGLTALGGGAGGGGVGGNYDGNSGGSGGGAAGEVVSTGGAGTAGQGFAGGNSSADSGGGGGGAGGAGGNGGANTGGTGGIGVYSGITGRGQWYGGGGGGGAENSNANRYAAGLGGGMVGGYYQINTTRTYAGGWDYTGGGGGGGTYPGAAPYYGGSGGNGIVVIRYKCNHNVLGYVPPVGRGMLVHLDPGDVNCYSHAQGTNGETTVYNLADNLANGTTGGSRRLGLSNEYGGEFIFDGATDGNYINISNIPRVEQYTIMFWAKREAENRMPTGAASGTGHYWYGDNSWRYSHSETSGELYYNKSVDIPLDTWGHYCVTYDGSKVTVYRNGVLESTQATTGTSTFASGIQVGWGYANNAYRFDGSIGNYKFYKHALGDLSVKLAYEQERARYGV